MALSVRTLTRDCLNITGAVSLQRDILTLRELPPPRSLQEELRFIRSTRCRPERPTDLRVTDVAQGSISLAWSDNSDNEDGFRIRFRGRKPGFSDDEGTVSRGRNQTSASLTGLRGGFDYTVSVAAFNAAGESAHSNEAQATTPAVEETRTVSLERQIIVQGNVPYLGAFPSFGVVPKGHLLRIRVPGTGLPNLALAFVKRGHSTAECGNPSAVVVLSEGQTSTPQQLTDIFGVSEPEFTALDPVTFLACIALDPPTSPLPDRVMIEITVVFE